MANISEVDAIYEQFKSVIDEVQGKISTEINTVEKNSAKVLDNYNDTISDLEENFRLMNDRIIKENTLKICSLEDQYTEITNKVAQYDVTINNELIKKGTLIEDRIASLAEAMKNAEDSLHNKIIERNELLSNETESIINSYKSDLSEVKDNMVRVSSLYENKLNDKYNEVDKEFIERMKDVNELVERINDISRKYSGKLEDFDFKCSGIESDISDRLSTIENDYNEKSVNLIGNSKNMALDLERKYSLLNEKIDEINKGFATDIDCRILQAKTEIDSIVNNGGVKLNNQIENVSEDISNRFDSFKSDMKMIKSSYDQLENDFHSRFDAFIQEKDDNSNVKINQFIDIHNENLSSIKYNLSTIQDEFQNKMIELESYYRDKVGSVVDEKVKFIISAEDRLNRIDNALSDNEMRIESDIDNKLESARKLIDSFFESSHSNFVDKYKELENETVKSIEQYKNELTRIRQNIKVIDDKFGAKFVKKLEQADDSLNKKLTEITSEYSELLEVLNRKLAKYDSDYVQKLESIELDFTDKNTQIIEKNKVELSEYTGRIESLMTEIAGVKNYLNEDFNTIITNGKEDIKQFFYLEKQVTIDNYKEVEDSIKDLVNSYKNQIMKIKEGIKTIDEKLSVKIADKLSEADSTLQQKYIQINEKYNENIIVLNARLEKIEESYIEKIDSLEEKYSSKGEKFIIDGYAKFTELQENINNITIDLNNLKSDLDADLSVKLSDGKSVLDNLFSDSKDQLEEYHSILKSKIVSDLDVQYQDVAKVKHEIKELDEKVNVGLIHKISQIEDKIGNKFIELTAKYNEQISGVKERLSGFESGFNTKLDLIADEFSEKNEIVLRENFEKISDYTFRFKELESSINDLKQRIENEISEKIDSTLTNSFEIINRKGNEISKQYENASNEYTTKLSELESHVFAKIEKADSLYNNGLEDIKVNFLSLKNSLSADFESFTKSITDSHDVIIRNNDAEITDISSKYVQLQESISEMELQINTQKEHVIKNGQEITNDFNKMFELFFEDANKEKAILFKENEKELYNLSLRFQTLDNDIIEYKNRIDNSITEKLVESLHNVNTIVDTRVSAIQKSYNTLSDDLDSRSSNYISTLRDLENKINSFDTIFIDKLNAKLGNTDSYITERIGELSTSVKKLEDEYQQRFVGIDTDFNNLKDTLSEQSIEHIKALKSKYDHIGLEIGSLEEKINDEISNKIIDGVNQLEKIMNEKIATLKDNEKEVSLEIIAKIRKQSEIIDSMYNKTTNLENEYRLAIENGLSNSSSIIEESIEKVNQKIAGLEIEHSNKLDVLLQTMKDDSSQYFQEVNEYVVGLQNNYQQLDESISLIKNRIDTDIHNRLEKSLKGVDIIVEQKTSEISAQYETIKSETSENVKNLIDKLSYVSNQFNRIDNEISERIHTKTDTELLKVSESINRKNIELQSSIDVIKNSSEIKLNEYRRILDSFTEEINGVNEVLNERIDERIEIIESSVRERISKLTSDIENMKQSFENEISVSIHSYKSKEIDTFAQTQEKINQYESQIDTFQSELNEIKLSAKDSVYSTAKDLELITKNAMLDTGEKINSINLLVTKTNDEIVNFKTTLVDSITNEIDSVKTIVSQSNETVKNFKQTINAQLTQQAEEMKLRSLALEDNVNTLFAQLNSDVTTIKNDKKQEIEKTFDVLKQEITVVQENTSKVLQTIESNVSLIRNNVAKEIEHTLSNIKDSIEIIESKYKDSISGINNDLTNFKSAVISDFNSGVLSLRGSIKDLEVQLENKYNQTISRFNSGYDSTVAELKTIFNENISDYEIEYKNTISSIVNDFRAKSYTYDVEYLSKLEKMENQYLTKLHDFGVQYEVTLNDKHDILIQKVNSIDVAYVKEINTLKNIFEMSVNEMQKHLGSVQDELMSRTMQIDDQYTDKYTMLESDFRNISANISDIKINLSKDIMSTVDSVLNDAQIQYSEREAGLADHFRTIEKEMVEKINNYRSEMHKVQQNISGLEIKYGDLFNRKIGEFDAKIAEKFVNVRGTVDDNLKMLNEKITEIASDYSSKIDLVSQEFSDKAETMLMKNAKRLDDFEMRYSDINEKISVLKNSVQDEILVSIQSGKDDIREVLAEEINTAKEHFNSTSNEVKSGINDFKNDFIKLQNSMKQIDDKFSARFIEHSNILGKRISTIENEVDKFEKNLLLVEKTNSMKDKLNDEIKDIKEKISSIRVDKEALQKIEKNILNIETIAKASEEKYSKLFNDAKRLDNINQVLNELKEMTESVEVKIENIKNAKALISNVESGINLIKTKSDDVEKMIKELDKKGEIIQVSMDSIESARDEASKLRGMISDLNRNYDELDFKRGTYEKNIKEFEKDASIIMKSQSKINDIMNKFKEMDSFVIDIEERTTSIMKLREWLVKAETQIENLNYETDKRIKTLEAINSSPVESAKKSGGQLIQEDSKRKMVIQLKSQGWAIDDIAKTSGLSIGEVEFILDLEISSNKK